ncbi:MAG: hypothetical protein MJ060_02025 [Clostridia bacterium]|nr:hypothetical protein [Clostridia bacterium]
MLYRLMQIAVSIEPFLAAEKSKLIQYIEKIVQLKQNQGHVCMHFDYFRSNPEIFSLVRSYTQKIEIDLHLMQEPAPSVEGFRSVSVDVNDWQKPELAHNLRKIGSSGRGLVLDLGCEIKGYEDLIRAANYVIIMTVKCGKSGQILQASALELIPQVRCLNPDVIIIVDGGVNENNINLLKNAGVDIAVVGNYAKKCYENGDLALGINRLLHN